MPTVLIADEHEIIRMGLRQVMEREMDLQIVGETGDGYLLTELVEDVQPDALVLDPAMPGLGGFEVLRRLRRRKLRTRVVAYSSCSDGRHVCQALRHGAFGYVLKETCTAELVRALREVCKGRLYLSPPLSFATIPLFPDATEPEDPYVRLTAREREVFHLAARGLSNAETGKRLGIATRTAETHRTHIIRKLGLRGQIELVNYAYRRGLLPVEPRARR